MFEKYLSTLVKLLSSPLSTKIVKASPLLVVPILFYVLGLKYINTKNKEELSTIENEKIQLITETNLTLKPVIGAFLLRNYDSINGRKLEEFIKLYSHFNTDTISVSKIAMQHTFDFIDTVNGLKTNNVNKINSENQLKTIVSNPYPPYKIDESLYFFLLSNTNIESTTYTKNLLNLLKDKTFLSLNSNKNIKPLLSAFLNQQNISKRNQKSYFLNHN